MTNFKVGDTVKVIKPASNRNNGSPRPIGYIYTISEIIWNSGNPAYRENIGISDGLDSNCLQLATSNQMSIKEKFITAFLKEPEKSFRKAGITNGDGFLTEDGVQVFLAYLLSQNGAAFKTAVVDDLLKDVEPKTE